MVKERSLARMILTNLWNSIKPRRSWGVCVGKDYLGTEYYEIKLTESSTRRRPSRWFKPKSDDFEQEIPPEWEAWLRYRRDVPPTEEEIQRNLEVMMLRKQKATEIERNENKIHDNVAITSKNFPVREDMEGIPGASVKGRR